MTDLTLPTAVTTPRLALPLWTADDVAAIRDGGHRAGWDNDFPREDDRDAAGMFHRDDSWGPRSIVWHDGNGLVVGSIGFFGPPDVAADGVPETEVGYGLVESAREHGLVTEALAALLVETDAVGARIRAGVSPENAKSIRVLVKCGFTGLRGSDEDGNLVMVRPLPS